MTEKKYQVRLTHVETWVMAKGTELPGDLLEYTVLYDMRNGDLVETYTTGTATKEFWREVVEDLEFTCPNCGSHAYGTHTTQGVSAEHTTSTDGKYQGLCNGYSEVKRFTGRHQTNPVERCNFTWPRTAEEDAKVFKGTGRYSPKFMTATVVKQA